MPALFDITLIVGWEAAFLRARTCCDLVILGFRIALRSLVTDLFLAFRLASSLLLLFDVVTLKQSGRGSNNMFWLGQLNASKIIASGVRGVSVTVAEGASTAAEGALGPIE